MYCLIGQVLHFASLCRNLPLKFFSPLRDWLGSSWSWLRWVVAAGVLAFLFHQHRDSVLELSEAQIHWGLLALALVCCLAAQMLTFLRWYLLVWALDIPFRVHDALRLGFIGYLFNYVAPGAVGGDLIKASMIAREQSSRRLAAVGTVFLDRVIGLMSLMLLGAGLMFWPTPVLDAPKFQYVIGIFQVGSLVSLLGIGVVLLPGFSRWRLLDRLVGLPKIGPILGEPIYSVRMYQSRWRVLVLSLVMGLVSHTILILSIYLSSAALHGTAAIPSFVEHLQILPPAELVGVVVPLPGGTGALEGAIGYFYTIAGSRQGQGFLAGIAYRLVTIVLAVVGAGWYMSARREIDDVLHEVPPADGTEKSPGEPPTVDDPKCVASPVSQT